MQSANVRTVRVVHEYGRCSLKRTLAAQSCDSSLESHCEDVVRELCILAESSNQQVAEWIDNRIGDVIAGQERRRKQHGASGIQFGDHEARRSRHKDVSRGIGDDLSGCWNLSNPDLSAGRMNFRSLNKGRPTEINGGAGQQDISGGVLAARKADRSLAISTGHIMCYRHVRQGRAAKPVGKPVRQGQLT